MKKISVKDFNIEFGYEKIIKNKLLENFKRTIRF